MAAQPTRKSHKPKRQWKSPERVKPEPRAALPATSSEQDAGGVVSRALVPPASSKDVPDKPSETLDSPESSVVLAPPKPEKPYWYRPPDSKARKIFLKVATMRAAGRTDADIAKKLDTTEQSVRQYVYLAKMNKWADDDGEPVDLEAEMALSVDRKLVRNINHALDGGFTNYQTHEMTLELMKRRKVVSDVQEAGTALGLPNVVAIQVVMPPLGAAQQTVVEANIGGVPAFQEGEVVGGQVALESGQARADADQADAAPV